MSKSKIDYSNLDKLKLPDDMARDIRKEIEETLRNQELMKLNLGKDKKHRKSWINIEKVYIYSRISNEIWIVFFFWSLLSILLGWAFGFFWEAPKLIKILFSPYAKETLPLEYNAFCFAVIFSFLFIPVALFWYKRRNPFICIMRPDAFSMFWNLLFLSLAILAVVGAIIAPIHYFSSEKQIPSGRSGVLPLIIKLIELSGLGWKGIILYCCLTLHASTQLMGVTFLAKKLTFIKEKH